MKISRAPLAVALIALPVLAGCTITNPNYHPGATADVSKDGADQQAIQRQMEAAQAQANAQHTQAQAGGVHY